MLNENYFTPYYLYNYRYYKIAMVTQEKWDENDSEWKKNQTATYKIIFTVKETPEPKSIGDKPLHVTWPCPIYKVGDKMTFDPHRIILEDTDAVCFNVLEDIQPLLKRYKLGPLDKKDALIHENFKFVRCSDAERAVLFEVTRVPFDAAAEYSSWRQPSLRPNREMYYELMPTKEEQMAGHRGKLVEGDT